MSSFPTPASTDTDIDAPALTRERERFDWFARRLKRWIGYYSIDELKEFLTSPANRPGQRKKALVLLALSDDADALETLKAFEPSDESERLELLYRVALERALERHGHSPQRAAQLH